VPGAVSDVHLYILFTSNVTICLPEHFAISNGLLTMAFVAPLLAAVPRTRFIILGILAPLLGGGTTVANAIFPVAVDGEMGGEVGPGAPDSDRFRRACSARSSLCSLSPELGLPALELESLPKRL
jgi:hypothetical protein